MADVQKRGTPASRSAKPVGGKGATTTAVVKKGELIPATFLAVEAQDATDYDLPAGMEGATIAPSSLTPTVQWEQPGNFVKGEYLGMQEKVGPNASRLYNLRLEDGEVVSLWGATVLDNRMDLLRVPVGATLTVIFVGESVAKKGQNPAKLFKVAYKL